MNDTPHPHPSADDNAPAPRGRADDSLHRDERGQVSILFVIAVIALVFLIALIFNTARQTTRKIEMQGAADSAAVAGGVWVARGMNLMVLNNNTMADVLAVMITLRSLLQTAQTMRLLLPGMAAAAAAFPPTAWMAPIFLREAARYLALSRVLQAADNTLSRQPGGFGWRVMSILDRFNQFIKTSFPFVAEAQAISFARRNGADAAIPGLLVGGQPGSLTRLLPLLPVARGPQGLLAARAADCQLKKLRWAAITVLVLTGPLSSPVAIGIYLQMVSLNVASLGGTAAALSSTVTVTRDDLLDVRDGDGRGIEDMVDDYNAEGEESGRERVDMSGFRFRTFSNAVFAPPLTWPSNPPRPMTLTDRPRAAGSATTNVSERTIEMTRPRRHLQLLAFAFGRMPDGSAIGGEQFPNPSIYGWLTFAQADVYNPTRWEMFTQDWRAKLARSRVFNERATELSGRLGLRFIRSRFWTFVNTH